MKTMLPRNFALFVISVCILIFALELINGRFWLNDFRVYYESAIALFNGSQVYAVPRGFDSAFYKYSPFILIFFTPLIALKFQIAAIVYYFLSVGVLLGVFVVLKRILSRLFFHPGPVNKSVPFIIVFVFSFMHLHRELHLGNTNLLLLLLVLLALNAITTNKQLIGGVFLAVAVLFKPFLAILFLPLIMHGKWKALASIASFSIFQFLIMTIIWGLHKTVLLHNEWLMAILDHSGSYQSSNSLAYMFDFYLGLKNLPYINFIALLAVAIIYLLYFFINRRRLVFSPGSKPDAGGYLMVESFMLIAILPNILNTDTQVFLFSMPIIALLVFYFSRKRSYILTPLFFIIFLFYGTNSNDVVGNTIGNFLDKIGAIGLANLALIIMLLVVSHSLMHSRTIGDVKPGPELH